MGCLNNMLVPLLLTRHIDKGVPSCDFAPFQQLFLCNNWAFGEFSLFQIQLVNKLSFLYNININKMAERSFACVENVFFYLFKTQIYRFAIASETPI